MSNWTKVGCWRYRAELQECGSSHRLHPEAGPQFDAHLRECSDCRKELDDALLAAELLRHANALRVHYSNILIDDSTDSRLDSSNAFSMRVMASIREELSRRATPDMIWRPLEMLASRFAVAAAAVLLMLSIYLAEFAPPLRPAPAASQTEIGAIMPEPPAQPATPDEVLMSLAGEGQ